MLPFVALIILLSFVSTVSCGIPLPPTSGYIFPYDDTSVQSTLSFVCDNRTQAHQVKVFSAICDDDGNWEPSPFIHCVELQGKQNHTI